MASSVREFAFMPRPIKKRKPFFDTGRWAARYTPFIGASQVAGCLFCFMVFEERLGF